MELIYDIEDIPKEIDVDMIKKATSLCLQREGVNNNLIEISLSFVGEDEIKEINAQFRNIDKSTDVLSFPQYCSAKEVPESGFSTIGDVVICLDVAKKQAEEFQHSLEREIIYLFVHSMFHLLGYDHMCDEDKADMRQAEEEIMSLLRLERI